MPSIKELINKLEKPQTKFIDLRNRLVHIGTASLQSPERARVISTNQFILLALALTLSFQLYYLLFEFQQMFAAILVHTIASGVYILALVANARGMHLTAACAALAGPLFFQVPAICFLISAESGMHVFLLAGGIFTFVVFPNNQKGFRLVFIAFSLLFFILIERYFTRDLAPIKLPETLLTNMVYLNAIGTSLMIYLLSSLSHRMILEQGNEIRLQAKSLEMLAHTDVLTQLPNRRQIMSAATTPLGEGNSFVGVVAIADIDHFKRVNDQYGHDCGDEILRSVACTMSSSMRPIDIVGRWGGEEFIFLLAGLNMEDAQPIMQRLRVNIEKTAIEYKGQLHYITVSIGAAEMSHKNSFQEVFRQADQALYHGKQNGRNCFIASLSDLHTNEAGFS
ncbi:MAG: GGDEF domain-containing protein [Pseudomonadales bacterium]|nr:GGDEF domain-containing protein [Pseudomonadales bacterium]